MLNQLNRDRSSPPVPQSGSNEQEITDTVDAVLSISSLVLRCFKDFQTLLSALSTQHELSSPRSKVSEELGRLRVWAGNFGAHRKQTDRLSLDHRLREAPDLHRGVRNHLNDLSETIQEASAHLSKSPKSTGKANMMDEDNTDSESSDSDGFWEQIKTEGSHRSPIDVYADDLSHTVTSLYKLSLALQNPARRDRSVQASRIDLHHFEFYDIHHVCDKFNLAPDNELAQRLGRANTKRRQLLAYYKDHSERISKYIDVTLNKAVSAPPDNPITIESRSEYQQRLPTISTQWTQGTTVSTIYQDIDVASNSGRTRFSATTSTTGDQDQNLIPPPPSGSSVTRLDLFICPYCQQTVQIGKDEDWIYHVYSDLQPYICTLGGCVKENQLYDSFTEWSTHERQFHRREWFCMFCPYTTGEQSLLIRHLDDGHTDIAKEQRQEMANQSRSSTSAQQCPLCTKPPISNSSRFQQHLARHLQQLALFVLPRGASDDEESAAREEDSNESRQALMMDEQERKNLFSISADSKASVSEGSISDQHYHPIDDRSLDAIPKEATEGASESIGNESEGASSVDPLEGHPEAPRKREADAIAALEDSRNTVGPDHPNTMICMERIAQIYQKQGRYCDLDVLLGELLEMKQRLLGPEHGSTISSMALKGNVLYHQSRYAEAEEVQAVVLRVNKQFWGTESHLTWDSMYQLTLTYAALGRFDEAEELALQLIENRKRVLGEDHADTLWAIRAMALISIRKGDYEKSEVILLHITEASEKQDCSLAHWDVSICAALDLAAVYLRKGEPDRAEIYLKMMLDRLSAFALRDDVCHRLSIMGALANVYLSEPRLDDAETLYKVLLERAARSFGTPNTYWLDCAPRLANILYRKGKFAEAQAMMAECAEDMLKVLGPDSPQTVAAFDTLRQWAVLGAGIASQESNTLR